MYRGISFRSLLELSVIRHLEADGLVLGETMLYEAVTIPWGLAGRRRYIVDLSFPTFKMLAEIKPESRVGNRNNVAKRRAAEAWCLKNDWSYVIITDEMLASCGKILTLDEASKTADVQLNERAKRTLRRREAKTNKRKQAMRASRGARRRR